MTSLYTLYYAHYAHYIHYAHYTHYTPSTTGAYDVLKKKFSAASSFQVDTTTVDMKYDTEAKDPVLSVSSSIDSNNEVYPMYPMYSTVLYFHLHFHNPITKISIFNFNSRDLLPT
jgi:hypothetical protein